MKPLLQTHPNNTNENVADEQTAAAVFRPVQYLGSKLRVLDKIRDATSDLIGSSGTVVDLFSGSTVVAQCYANLGYRVHSVDVELYSSIFAQALLNVDRRPDDELSVNLLEQFSLLDSNTIATEQWTNFAHIERQLLSNRDAEGLKALYNEIPLAWTDPSAPFYNVVSGPSNSEAFGKAPLLTILYSGRYFGIGQALKLDQYLHSIHSMLVAGRISKWQRSAYLTAIMYAASQAVHSAGKHFAQPLNGKNTGNRQFGNKRLLQDRDVSIRTAVQACLEAINHAPLNLPSEHKSFQMSAEQFCARPPVIADLYYLDPPYTAQQYSRFYHVLNVISAYRFPQVVNDGVVTQGIYPTSRYKSAFSSKTKALPALSAMIERSHTNGIALLISYSESASGSNGNARMMSLDSLLDRCRKVYGNEMVELRRTAHSYRQFNSDENANAARNDPEVLILCKAR